MRRYFRGLIYYLKPPTDWGVGTGELLVGSSEIFKQSIFKLEATELHKKMDDIMIIFTQGVNN